ncbi:MAG: hypothetical protein KatS3mg129_0992 [Leptospiraceae bacterium]|nr:MAG: hypothetical protein KatS3mg129_0992 [Leptospiraceae bacterium]
MKYYYKTPEQVQEEIKEHIKQNKTSPYNKTFFLILLNIIIIMIILLVLDKTGILHKTFSYKSIKAISYQIQNHDLVLYFDVYRPIILTSTKSTNEYVLQLQKIIILLNNHKKTIEIEPIIPKTIIDKESKIIRIHLPESIIQKDIINIKIIINEQIIEAKSF